MVGVNELRFGLCLKGIRLKSGISPIWIALLLLIHKYREMFADVDQRETALQQKRVQPKAHPWQILTVHFVGSVFLPGHQLAHALLFLAG